MKKIKKCILFSTILSVVFLLGCDHTEQMSLEDAIWAATSENMISEEASETAEQAAEAETQLLYVYVCGEVLEPGVYTLEPGSRIVAAVEAAGGFLPEAATEAVNLAEPVQDGMQIVVPDLETYADSGKEAARQAAGLINLNTATVAELCTLSGIGETKAEAILAYRRELGFFSTTEQIKEVSGIGDSLFEQIKDYIYID